MTPDQEIELRSDMKHLIRAIEEQGRNIMMLREQMARMEGKQDVMLTWLQSTDQRFTAIMAPYQQRQAS
ncbi:MAG: hypothetical protein WCF85_20720 [Rhodospirillaceae bacterium]